jgi:Tfp pilus assembly protein PilO
MKSFLSLLFIAVSIVVFFVMVKPKYESLQDLRTSVATANANLDTAAKLTKSRDDLMARYQKITKEDLDNLKTLLPDSVNNIRLIIQINSLATKNNLSLLRNVDYQTEEVATKNQDPQAVQKPYGEFTMSFQTTGQYKNFLAFISDLEQNLRLVDVVRVDLTPADQGVQQNAGSSFSYKVTLQTYWLKQ